MILLLKFSHAAYDFKREKQQFFSCFSICPPAGRFCCIFDLNFRLNGRHSMLYDISLVFFVCFCMINCHSLVFFSEGNFLNFCFSVFSNGFKVTGSCSRFSGFVVGTIALLLCFHKGKR